MICFEVVLRFKGAFRRCVGSTRAEGRARWGRRARGADGAKSGGNGTTVGGMEQEEGSDERQHHRAGTECQSREAGEGEGDEVDTKGLFVGEG